MGPEDKAKPGEPGTVAAGAKKLKDHQTESVLGNLTEQEAGRRADGSIEEGTPREGKGAGAVPGKKEEGGEQ